MNKELLMSSNEILLYRSFLSNMRKFTRVFFDEYPHVMIGNEVLVGAPLEDYRPPGICKYHTIFTPSFEQSLTGLKIKYTLIFSMYVFNSTLPLHFIHLESKDYEIPSGCGKMKK